MQNNNSQTSNPKTAPTGIQTHELTLAALGAIMRRRWIWIAVSVVLGLGLAGVYFVTTEPTFESSAQVLVMRKDPRLATAGQTSGETESKISEDLLATHMQLVQSRRMVGDALSLNQLDKLPSITERLDDDETPTKYVIDNLLVTRGGVAQAKDAHVLNIAFRHKSDVDAQQILTAIIEQYQAFLAERFQDVNSEAADLIAKAQKDLGSELEKSEEQYRQFREQAPLLWNGQQSTNIHRMEYDLIQAEMSQLRLQSTESKSRLELVESALKDMESKGASALERLALIDEKNAERIGIIVNVDQGKAQTAQFQASMPDRTAGSTVEAQNLLALQLKAQTLAQDFGPNHPEVRSVREQINKTQEFLTNKFKSLGIVEEDKLLDPKELVDAYVSILRNDLAATDRRQQQLQLQAAVAEEAAKGLVSYELEGETLRKLVARQQELYDAVVDRLREINLAKDYGGFINEVIAPAEIGEKIWPRLPIVLALGMVLGLAVGCGGAAAREAMDRSFRNPEEIHQALQLPLLTLVPSLTNLKPKSATTSALATSLLTFYHPRSREAEVFRGLRTSLFFDAKSRRLTSALTGSDADSVANLQIIALTSPNQGDGKSTVLANLAVSIAQTGRNVLLVDCDMRRPRVHELFGIENRVGLVNVISGEVEPWDAVQSTDVEHLSAMTCGPVPPNPAELLTLPAFEQFLGLARQRYDFILIDCPPVLAVADPCIVASHCDAIALVVRVNADSRPQAIRAKDMLIAAGANVLGTVVNVCDSKNHFDYGNYGYGYGYGYRDGNSNGVDHYYQAKSTGEETKRDVMRS